jgi:hypothetical protein
MPPKAQRLRVKYQVIQCEVATLFRCLPQRMVELHVLFSGRDGTQEAMLQVLQKGGGAVHKRVN